MTDEILRVSVGGINISVPILKDEKTTLKIIDDVNDRIEEIESSTSRVDSQAFAIMAAVSFATELQQLKLAQQAENKEIAVALDSISNTMQAILEEFEETE